MTAPLKRQKSIAHLREYLAGKIDKHLDSLTEEQIAELQKKNDQGEFLSSSKIIVSAVRHGMSESNARKAVDQAVKETERDVDPGELIDTLAEQRKALALKIRTAMSVNSDVEGLFEYDFVKQSAAGLGNAYTSWLKLQKRLVELEASITKTDTVIAELKAAVGDEGDLGEAVQRGSRRFFSNNEHLEEISKLLENAGVSLQKMLESESLYNYMRSLDDDDKSQARQNFAKYSEQLNRVYTALSVLVPKGWSWVNGVVNVFKTALQRGVDEALIYRDMGAFEEEQGVGAIFEMHDKDPTVMAAGLIDKHKANLELLIAAIGTIPAVSDLPWWNTVTGCVQKVVEGILDEKLERAKALLPKKPDDPEQPPQNVVEFAEKYWGDLKKDIGDRLPGAIAEEMKGVAGEILDWAKDPSTYTDVAGQYDEGQVDPMFVVNKVVNMVVAALVPKIVKWFDPAPAQAVSGSELRGLVNGLARQHIPEALTTPIVPDKQRARRDRRVPADYKGHKIVDSHLGQTEVIDEEAGHFVFFVCLEYHGTQLWGRLNTKERMFYAVRPADSSRSDWSSRVILENGYRAVGSDEKVTGTWYRPWQAGSYYLFRSADDNYEWALGFNDTADLHGRQHSIHSIFDKYPGWLDSWVWDPGFVPEAGHQGS